MEIPQQILLNDGFGLARIEVRFRGGKLNSMGISNKKSGLRENWIYAELNGERLGDDAPCIIVVSVPKQTGESRQEIDSKTTALVNNLLDEFRFNQKEGRVDYRFYLDRYESDFGVSRITANTYFPITKTPAPHAAPKPASQQPAHKQ